MLVESVYFVAYGPCVELLHLRQMIYLEVRDGICTRLSLCHLGPTLMSVKERKLKK